ncbi:hypothetical protein GCM10010345_76800 [Streptomyces canarius]|uniref:Uncharacterized protein n=1 Tax=Streptomyces canarius TaxID=285453 RepID=A0ABQ3D8Q2_9ACTN|nr:hypothetical protein GCM10010345_76800 [Streptomyces canarius]
MWRQAAVDAGGLCGVSVTVYRVSVQRGLGGGQAADRSGCRQLGLGALPEDLLDRVDHPPLRHPSPGPPMTDEPSPGHGRSVPGEEAAGGTVVRKQGQVDGALRGLGRVTAVSGPGLRSVTRRPGANELTLTPSSAGVWA